MVGNVRLELLPIGPSDVCKPLHLIPEIPAIRNGRLGPAPSIALSDKPTLLLSYIINLALHLGGETPADVWPTAACVLRLNTITRLLI